MSHSKFDKLFRRDDKGELFVEKINIQDIAFHYGTPTYVYSYDQLRQNCTRFIKAFSGVKSLICFAVKANGNLSILREIFKFGLGADIVSLGEFERVLRAECSPNKIVFSGVGKKREEIEIALRKKVMLFNIESLFELEILSEISKTLRIKANVSFRVNPNIDAKTHVKISTGLSENKFGLSEENIPDLILRMRSEPYLDLVGLSCHIGSQITFLDPLRDTARRMAEICKSVKATGCDLKYIDLGGGLGIPYQNEVVPEIEAYAQCLIEETDHLGLQLIIEPGRSLIGDTGFLLTRVLGTKQNSKRSFVILDAAMNDLMRPVLYDSYHPIIPVKIQAKGAEKTLCQFVGPICETGDIMGSNREVELPTAGDLFLIGYTGAYGSSMSSQYNSRPRAAELLIDGDRVHVVRRRETLGDLWALEEPLSVISE